MESQSDPAFQKRTERANINLNSCHKINDGQSFPVCRPLSSPGVLPGSFFRMRAMQCKVLLSHALPSFVDLSHAWKRTTKKG